MTSLDPRFLDPKFLAEWSRKASQGELDRYWPEIKATLEARQYDWTLKARPEQLPPPGEWLVWLILAGRGFGKTRTGAEWVKRQALDNPGTRWAVVAPTYADARDTCIEGESGLMNVLPHSEVKTWNRSLGELVLANGSRLKLFSGDEPERLRGPQHHGGWVDELGAFRYPEAWDQLQFGLRLGERPRTVITTTPKPTKLIRSLVKREGVHITRGSTFDNAANLAAPALAELRARYEGTRLGRQELNAEILLDVPGALATYELIESTRVEGAPEMARIAVGVDPSGGDSDGNDEQGILVGGLGVDGHGYRLGDRSCKLSPDGWGRRSVQAYVDYKADLILVEVNFGGDMAEANIRQAAKDMGVVVKIKKVTASRGKRLRAEPVGALMEQNRVHFVGSFPELEDQWTTWTSDGGWSPDRMDADVMVMTELIVDAPKPGGFYVG